MEWFQFRERQVCHGNWAGFALRFSIAAEASKVGEESQVALTSEGQEVAVTQEGQEGQTEEQAGEGICLCCCRYI
jgi:hypothetical protein